MKNRRKFSPPGRSRRRIVNQKYTFFMLLNAAFNILSSRMIESAELRRYNIRGLINSLFMIFIVFRWNRVFREFFFFLIEDFVWRILKIEELKRDKLCEQSSTQIEFKFFHEFLFKTSKKYQARKLILISSYLFYPQILWKKCQ